LPGFRPAAGGRGAVATRHQHDRRRVLGLGQPPADLEAVKVGKLDVEQDHIRPQPRNGVQGRHGVGRLAHDLEAFHLQQGAGQCPEKCVVVDDQTVLVID
jgi:hypothetical protein